MEKKNTFKCLQINQQQQQQQQQKISMNFEFYRKLK